MAIVLAFASILPTAARGQSTPSCPPGMVWGYQSCVVKEYCPDGSPAMPGERCFDSGKRRDSKREADPPAEPPPKPRAAPEVEEPKIPVPACKPHFQTTDCQAKDWMGRKKCPRSLLVSGGKADHALDRYLQEAQNKGIDVDLDTVTLMFFDQHGQWIVLRGGSDVKITTAGLFQGKTIREAWRAKLKDIVTQARQNPIQDADKQGADVICDISPPPPPTAESQN